MLVENIHMTITYYIVGFIAGFIGSMVGLGGGFISNPFLLNIGLDPRFVVSSTRFLTLLTSLSSTYRYSNRIKIPIKIFLIVAIPMTILVFITAYFVAIINKEILQIIICIVLIYASIRTILSSIRRENTIESTGWRIKNYKVLATSGSVSGVVSGLTGLAGGLVNVPVFLHIVKIGVREAVALSLAVMIPSVTVGMIRHIIDNIVNWSIALPLGAGGLIGGLIGPKLALRTKTEKLKLLIGVTIIGATIKSLIDALMIIIS